MADEDPPLKRGIRFPSVATLVGVVAVAEGVLRHRWYFVVPGVLFVAGGLAMGYAAWRAHRRRFADTR